MAKKHQPEFKLRVVLDTYIKGSVSEVARHYELNANQISTWRKTLLEKGHLVFQAEVTEKEKTLERQVEQLENLLGKKELEITLLKKYLDFYAPQSGS
ncbi:MAG: transposase [Candidatus Cloacimonetes bacterium]|nr:transposase [Candidatus Cloacimonadota bacterium]